ncbi:hypothetical protein HHI36_012142 [Cryptolaemus montrouzieri]|uniref:Uncharacterized protein n=1 Tax=Cryptolaemus montrouzieri TaxID=559131 RepID=A0ABD2NE46_9CUCU
MLAVYPEQLFKKPMVEALEILHLLINNFPRKMEKYITDVNNICLMILNAFSASSDVKVKALSIFIIEFEKLIPNFENTTHYVDIYKGLRNSLNFKVGIPVS